MFKLHQVVLFTLAIMMLYPVTMQAEPAWWTQMKQACRDSGGEPSAEDYDGWVAGNGCKCPPSASQGSGQPACPAGTANSGGGAPSGNYATGQQLILNTSQQILAPMLEQAVHDAIYGNPQQDAIDAQRAAAQEAQQAALEKQYEEEQLRKQEAAKQRIMGQLKGGEDASGDLSYKTDDTGTHPVDSNLGFKTDDAENTMTTNASHQAGQGIDTAGVIDHATLPAAPPTPPGATQPSKQDIIRDLRIKLLQDQNKEKRLNDVITQYQHSPNPDPAVVQQLQMKLDDTKNAEKKLTVDLSVTEMDDGTSPPSSTSHAGTQTTTSPPAATSTNPGGGA